MEHYYKQAVFRYGLLVASMILLLFIVMLLISDTEIAVMMGIIMLFMFSLPITNIITEKYHPATHVVAHTKKQSGKSTSPHPKSPRQKPS